MIDRGDLTIDDTICRLTPVCWHYNINGGDGPDLFFGVRADNERDAWGKITLVSPGGGNPIYLFPHEILDIHLRRPAADPYPENSEHWR